jgi:hypothetical protein
MLAHSSLKTSFSAEKADIAAQYHLQKQTLTRSFFFFQVSIPLASDPRKKTTVEVSHFFLNRRSMKIWGISVKILFFFEKKRKEMRNLYVFFFLRTASQWDGDLGGKKKKFSSNFVFEDGTGQPNRPSRPKKKFSARNGRT